jgi:hypothetical protein
MVPNVRDVLRYKLQPCDAVVHSMWLRTSQVPMGRVQLPLSLAGCVCVGPLPWLPDGSHSSTQLLGHTQYPDIMVKS